MVLLLKLLHDFSPIDLKLAFCYFRKRVIDLVMLLLFERRLDAFASARCRLLRGCPHRRLLEPGLLDDLLWVIIIFD